jgi:DNA-binding CsgD family transcriptional regulator
MDGLLIFEFTGTSDSPGQDNSHLPLRLARRPQIEQILQQALVELTQKKSEPHQPLTAVDASAHRLDDSLSAAIDRLPAFAQPVRSATHLNRVQQTLAGLADQLRQRIPVEERLAHFEKLSERELEVLLRLLQGRSCKQISAALNIGLPAVTKHRTHLFQKLQVQSLAEILALVWSCTSDLPQQ